MNPLDYGYIAGEDLFYTWRFNETFAHRVLTRELTVALVDSGEEGTALGSLYQGIAVPPHMQGTYCKTLLQSDLEISEEE